jgi:hypothetical protein
MKWEEGEQFFQYLFEFILLTPCNQDLLEDSDDAHQKDIEESFAREANII